MANTQSFKHAAFINTRQLEIILLALLGEDLGAKSYQSVLDVCAAKNQQEPYPLYRVADVILRQALKALIPWSSALSFAYATKRHIERTAESPDSSYKIVRQAEYHQVLITSIVRGACLVAELPLPRPFQRRISSIDVNRAKEGEARDAAAREENIALLRLDRDTALRTQHFIKTLVWSSTGKNGIDNDAYSTAPDSPGYTGFPAPPVASKMAPVYTHFPNDWQPTPWAYGKDIAKPEAGFNNEKPNMTAYANVLLYSPANNYSTAGMFPPAHANLSDHVIFYLLKRCHVKAEFRLALLNQNWPQIFTADGWVRSAYPPSGRGVDMQNEDGEYVWATAWNLRVFGGHSLQKMVRTKENWLAAAPWELKGFKTAVKEAGDANPANKGKALAIVLGKFRQQVSDDSVKGSAFLKAYPRKQAPLPAYDNTYFWDLDRLLQPDVPEKIATMAKLNNLKPSTRATVGVGVFTPSKDQVAKRKDYEAYKVGHVSSTPSPTVPTPTTSSASTKTPAKRKAEEPLRRSARKTAPSTSDPAKAAPGSTTTPDKAASSLRQAPQTPAPKTASPAPRSLPSAKPKPSMNPRIASGTQKLTAPAGPSSMKPSRRGAANPETPLTRRDTPFAALTLPDSDDEPMPEAETALETTEWAAQGLPDSDEEMASPNDPKQAVTAGAAAEESAAWTPVMIEAYATQVAYDKAMDNNHLRRLESVAGLIGTLACEIRQAQATRHQTLRDIVARANTEFGMSIDEDQILNAPPPKFDPPAKAASSKFIDWTSEQARKQIKLEKEGPFLPRKLNATPTPEPAPEPEPAIEAIPGPLDTDWTKKVDAQGIWWVSPDGDVWKQKGSKYMEMVPAMKY